MAISGNTDTLVPNQTVDGSTLPNNVTNIVGAGNDTVTISGSVNRYITGPGNNIITFTNGGGYLFGGNNPTGDVTVNLLLGTIQNGFGGVDQVYGVGYVGANASSLTSVTIISDSKYHIFDLGDVNATVTGGSGGCQVTMFTEPMSQFKILPTSSNSLSITNTLINKTANLNNVGFISFSDALFNIANPFSIQKYFAPAINQYYFAGQTINININTANVSAGSQIRWSLSNTSGSYQQINSGTPYGTVSVSQNGIAVINIPVDSKITNNPTYSFDFNVGNGTWNTNTPTFTIVPSSVISQSALQINTGAVEVFNFKTQLPAGQTFSYTINGVGQGDIPTVPLTGTLTADPNGNATLTVPVANRSNYEGNETLTLTAGGTSSSFNIIDTGFH